MDNKIVIGLLGNVDVGKSTLIGVLTRNELDDGKGTLRNKILRYDHEREKGQTSSINMLHKDNYSFVDLAGHKKYLKTTIKGLTKYDIDYCLILISASKGITKMTKEHICIAKMLKKPIIIIITKIDMAPIKRYKKTIKSTKSMVKKSGFKQNFIIDMKNIEEVDSFIDKFLVKNPVICPMIKLSNKTGEGIDVLKYLLSKLKLKRKIKKSNDKIFKIYEKYIVDGIGKVFYGKVIQGIINKGDKLLIGPINDKWHTIKIKSIHDDDENDINILNTNQIGCVAVNISKELTLKKSDNLIITSMENKIITSYKYKADIFILGSNRTTFQVGYEPFINSKMCSQCCKITKIKDRDYLRGGDKAEIEIEFKDRIEYLKKGDIFIFRENETKGFGKIKEILC